MQIWIKKSFVVLISILTLGLVTPSQLMDSLNASKASDNGIVEAKTNEIAARYYEESQQDRTQFVEEMLKQAEEQSYLKFGERIKPVIENEFREIILPNIQKAIEETAFHYPEQELSQLTISEQPAGGVSEKIFHIKNSVTGKDVIRFHVRRDNPPQSGYWFNFHYHTVMDQFNSHHELGSIYWDKNMPPKWMS